MQGGREVTPFHMLCRNRTVVGDGKAGIFYVVVVRVSESEFVREGSELDDAVAACLCVLVQVC